MNNEFGITHNPTLLSLHLSTFVFSFAATIKAPNWLPITQLGAFSNKGEHAKTKNTCGRRRANHSFRGGSATVSLGLRGDFRYGWRTSAQPTADRRHSHLHFGLGNAATEWPRSLCLDPYRGIGARSLCDHADGQRLPATDLRRLCRRR